MQPNTREQDPIDEAGPMIALTAKELASWLMVSEQMIWIMSRDGRLAPRAIRWGKKCTRWRAQEIRQWMEASCPPREQWERLKGCAQRWSGLQLCKKCGENITQEPSQTEMVTDAIAQ